MESQENSDILRLPVDSEEHSFNSWQVKYKRSHILHSKCSNEELCRDETSESCLYCLYNRILQLPHVPDMVFPNNSLELKHISGCKIEFNALDALKRVSNGKLPLKIACADAWKESRMESGHMDEVKPFDWTFTTDYSGTLTGNFAITSTDTRIDLDKLRRRDKILFYHDLLMFEDELHDNGTAVCSVKIRVMPNSFFILLRYFLRIDGVMLRLNDTRYYHEFDTDFILREYTSKEAKAQDLNVPPSRLVDPSEVAQILPLITSRYEKLMLPSIKVETEDTTAIV